MTSGNLSGKPPAISNDRRWRICRALPTDSLHNRDIVQRMDDSWCAKAAKCCAVRGVCTGCAGLPPGFKNVPPVLCLGADREKYLLPGAREQAVLSQHLGDLSDDGIQMQWRERYA
ncbi:hypothetical protein ACNKHV_16995 [Shigella flexneri]